MDRHRSLLRSLLLLMLAAGPLQAQTVLLCDMMDLPRQESCCCDEPTATTRQVDAVDTSCDRPPCHPSPRDDSDGCCDSAVEMSYQGDAGAAVAKPPSDRSDPNPPATMLLVYELLAPPAPPRPAPLARPAMVVLPNGSDLYLRTERFRI